MRLKEKEYDFWKSKKKKKKKKKKNHNIHKLDTAIKKESSTPMKFKNLDLHDLFIETLWIFVSGYINSRATNDHLFLHEFIISGKIICRGKFV